MPRFIVIDPAGTARVVRRFVVIDASGTARNIRRAFVIDSGGTARLFFSQGVISISDESISEGPGLSGVNQSASYRLNSNGDIERVGTNASGVPITSVIGQWVDPTSAAGDFECRATLTGGSIPTGTFGVWQALTSTRAWIVATSSPDEFVFGTFTLEIRRVGGSTIEDTASISLDATRTG